MPLQIFLAIENLSTKICRMNFRPHFQFGFFFICLVSIAGFWGCGSSVGEKEFLGKFSELSNRRIQFRLNMKALGDSTRRQKKFATKAIEEAFADTIIEKKLDQSYALWSDSLRRNLLEAKIFFETQYSVNKPLISRWEKSEMQLDGMVQRIKSGDLSEKQGLDSMNHVLKNLDSLIVKTDTLLRISNRHYWEFRRNLDDYRYNSKNMKRLYEEANARKGSR